MCMYLQNFKFHYLSHHFIYSKVFIFTNFYPQLNIMVTSTSIVL